MNRLKAVIILSAVLTLSGITSCERSGVEAARESPLTDAKILSIDDRLFLKDAERSEIVQRTGAEIAMTQSTDADVLEFARQVAGERSEELAKLNVLMKLKDASQPPATEGELQLEVTHRLHGLTGSALDHAFISLMTAEQEQCIRIFIYVNLRVGIRLGTQDNLNQARIFVHPARVCCSADGTRVDKRML